MLTTLNDWMDEARKTNTDGQRNLRDCLFVCLYNLIRVYFKHDNLMRFLLTSRSPLQTVAGGRVLQFEFWWARQRRRLFRVREWHGLLLLLLLLLLNRHLFLCAQLTSALFAPQLVTVLIFRQLRRRHSTNKVTWWVKSFIYSVSHEFGDSYHIQGEKMLWTLCTGRVIIANSLYIYRECHYCKIFIYTGCIKLANSVYTGCVIFANSLYTGCVIIANSLYTGCIKIANSLYTVCIKIASSVYTGCVKIANSAYIYKVCQNCWLCIFIQGASYLHTGIALVYLLFGFDVLEKFTV